MVKIGAGHRETGDITSARQKQRGAKVAKLPRAPTRFSRTSSQRLSLDPHDIAFTP